MSGFDYDTFWTDVGDLYGYLEELHAIDAILDGIEERGLDDLYYPPGQGNFGNDYNTQIELGVTYPFTKQIRAVSVETTTPGYPASAPPTTTITPLDFGWIDDAYTDAADFRETVHGRFETHVEKLLKVHSDSFRSVSFVLVDTYATMKTSISTENWSGLQNQAGEWEGRAADDFFNNFESPFADIIDNHMWAIDYCNSLVSHAKAINDAGQVSLMNLVTAAKAMAKDQLLKRQEENRGMSAQEVLVLGSTVTGIAGALLFPVPGAAAALGSTSYLLNYASTRVPPEAEETKELEAASANAVDNALYAEIYELKNNVEKGFDSVSDMCDEMTGYIDNMEEVLDPRSPANGWIPIQVDRGTDGTFHHESSSRGG